MLLFVYGTLMSGFGNNRLLDGSEGNIPANLVGTAKTVEKFCMVTGGVPFITPAAVIEKPKCPTQIIGEVWDIGNVQGDAQCLELLQRLDRLEAAYTRVEHMVMVDGETEPRAASLYQARRLFGGDTNVKDGDWRKFVAKHGR